MTDEQFHRAEILRNAIYRWERRLELFDNGHCVIEFNDPAARNIKISDLPDEIRVLFRKYLESNLKKCKDEYVTL